MEYLTQNAQVSKLGGHDFAQKYIQLTKVPSQIMCDTIHRSNFQCDRYGEDLTPAFYLYQTALMRLISSRAGTSVVKLHPVLFWLYIIGSGEI